MLTENPKLQILREQNRADVEAAASGLGRP